MRRTYLLLNERLSQVWCNRYALVIILMMVKILIFMTLLQNSFENLKDATLSNCDTIDYYYAKYAGSTPHYMGLMGNFMIEKTMSESVSVALKSVSLLVSLSENVIDFMLDIWLGTWVCLIVSAIDGSVDVATNTTESLIDFFNGTVNTMANELDDGLNTLSEVINDIISAVDAVESLFTTSDSSNVDDDVTQVNLTISALRSIYIPSSIDEKLANLSANTPDFDTLKNKTKEAISVPFNSVQKEIKAINTTSLVGKADLLYVPPIESSGYKICADNEDIITQVFNALNKVLKTFTIIFVVLSCVAIIVSIIYSGWSEWREWQRLQQFRDHYHYQTDLIKNPFSDGSEDEQACNVDILETYQLIFHKYQSKIGEWIANIFSKEKITQANIQWVVTYMSSPTALTLLLIGLLGTLICCIQFLIIGLLEASLNRSGSTSFQNTAASLNNSTYKELNSWTISTNSYINETQTNINDKLFGWIQETSSSVNDTATELLQDIDALLIDAFNDTILYAPMSTVVDCVIGNKLESIISAMNWITEHAQLTLPQISSAELWDKIESQNSSSVSNSTSLQLTTTNVYQELTSAISEGAQKILRQYRTYVVKELLISLSILLVYSSLLLIASAFLFMRSRQFRSIKRRFYSKTI